MSSGVILLLADGSTCYVDEDLFDWLNTFRWYPDKGYALASVKGKTISMHRLVSAAPRGATVDHINRNPRDNRRLNLRFVNASQNQQNRHALGYGKTGVRGVIVEASKAKPFRSKPFRARVWLNGKCISLGYFASIDEAKQAAADGRRLYMTHSPERAEQIPANRGIQS